MSVICRCDQCNRLLLMRNVRYVCENCGARFCSHKCKELHECSGLPMLRRPWAEDDTDILEVLRAMIASEAGLVEKCVAKPGSHAMCRYCYTVNEILWTDKYLGPMCKDCYRELREKVVMSVKKQGYHGEKIAKGFLIYRFTDDIPMNRDTLLAIFLAKMDLEQTRRMQIKVMEGRHAKTGYITLHDLRPWCFDYAKVITVNDRILEFAPGMYVIVKELTEETMKELDDLLAAIDKKQKAAIKLVSCTEADFTRLLLTKVAGIEERKFIDGNLNGADWKAIAAAALKISECDLHFIERDEQAIELKCDVIVEI